MDSFLPRSRRLVAIAVALLIATAAVIAAPDADAKGKHHHGHHGPKHHGGKHGHKGKGKGRSAYLPPKGESFAGVSDTGQSSDYRQYRDAVQAHPAVMQSFESWGYVPQEAINRWSESRTRGMLSLSTKPCWDCHAKISTGSIANGKGDGYLLSLSQALAKRHKPTYIRLFPEMNADWNPYSAFEHDGDPRGKLNSTASFKAAWKRIVLILRGGKLDKLNHELKKLKQPKLQAEAKAKLPDPKVAFAFVPQAKGSPDIPANGPENYFPGKKYVDWVGGDVYGKYPSLAGLTSIYRKFGKLPYLVGEWSPWNRDDPAFVKSLFGWAKKHSRTRMLVYYQGFGEGKANDFEITDYPKCLKTVRTILDSKRFLQFAPEEQRHKGHGGKHHGGGKRKHGKLS